MAICLSRRPTVSWTPSSDVSSDIEVDATSLGDVTSLLVAAVLMNSFAFDSPPATKIVAKCQQSCIMRITRSFHDYVTQRTAFPVRQKRRKKLVTYKTSPYDNSVVFSASCGGVAADFW